MKTFFLATSIAIVLMALFSRSTAVVLTPDEEKAYLSLLALLFYKNESKVLGKELDEFRKEDFNISGEQAGEKYDLFSKPTENYPLALHRECHAFVPRATYVGCCSLLLTAVGPGQVYRTDEIISGLDSPVCDSSRTVRQLATLVFCSMVETKGDVTKEKYLALVNTGAGNAIKNLDDVTKAWEKISSGIVCTLMKFTEVCNTLEKLVKVYRGDGEF